MKKSMKTMTTKIAGNPCGDCCPVAFAMSVGLKLVVLNNGFESHLSIFMNLILLPTD